MPRQRTQYRRRTYDFPDNFPERLKRFQKESGLSWSEIAHRIGTYRHTVWRWTEGKVRPNVKHMLALLELAGSLVLIDNYMLQITALARCRVAKK